MNTVAIIPARGGSKGIPRKNLRSLCGKPLLYYTINAAQHAVSLNSVIVSTDDNEIADYVSSLGNVIVFRHPAELSNDFCPSFPVIQWAVKNLKEYGLKPDICVALRATSPLRTNDDIDIAVKLLLDNKNADSVVSVVPAMGIHPIKLKRLLEENRLVDSFMSEGNYPKQRQELELFYLHNGAIFVAQSSLIEQGCLWSNNNCLAYIMPEERSININTQFDFKIAELLISASIGKS